MGIIALVIVHNYRCLFGSDVFVLAVKLVTENSCENVVSVNNSERRSSRKRQYRFIFYFRLVVQADVDMPRDRHKILSCHNS